MTYSVWDQSIKAYRYYETPEPQETVNSPKPRHVRGGRIGAAPEQAAWPLPGNARETGTGQYPRGHVATRRGALGGLIDIDLTPTNVLLIGALGYMVYQFLWKPAVK